MRWRGEGEAGKGCAGRRAGGQASRRECKQGARQAGGAGGQRQRTRARTCVVHRWHLVLVKQHRLGRVQRHLVDGVRLRAGRQKGRKAGRQARARHTVMGASGHGSGGYGGGVCEVGGGAIAGHTRHAWPFCRTWQVQPWDTYTCGVLNNGLLQCSALRVCSQSRSGCDRSADGGQLVCHSFHSMHAAPGLEALGRGILSGRWHHLRQGFRKAMVPTFYGHHAHARAAGWQQEN